MTKPDSLLGDQVAEPFESALEAAFDELTVVQKQGFDARQQVQQTDRRATELNTAIRSLIDVLPPHRRSRYLIKLQQMSQDATLSSRGGEVFNNVVRLLTNQPHAEITTTEVKRHLADTGAPHDQRSVDNVMNYLAKSGRLRRIGRGRYLIRELNIEVQLGFDLEGEASHVPEDSDE